MQESRYKTVRANLASRITRGDLKPGDRLSPERDLASEFGVTRTTIRQAIAGLARDGLVVSAYPRGYLVRGPRIPWLPRLRPLVDEPWEIEIIDTTRRTVAPGDEDAERFDLTPGDTLALCYFQLRGAHTRQPWALAHATYPLDAFNDATRELLHSAGFIDDDQLEHVSGRRIVGYHEHITARLTTASDREQLELDHGEALLVLTRTARTTTSPIAQLTVAARTRYLDVDQLVDA